MRLEVDASEAVEAADLADELLKRDVPSIIRKAVAVAARDEQRFHVFDNYTGNLEKSIKAVNVSRNETQMVAGEKYASYVAARGRLNLKGARNAAKISIDREIERISSRLSKA